MIYIVRFLAAAAWSCFYPFMAVWLNTVVGLGTSAAGIVVGCAIVANRVGALAFQSVLDKLERRLEIALALLCVAVCALLMLLAAAFGITNIIVWLVLVVVFGVANSVATISQISYIVQHFREGEHERVLSYENVAANAGAGIAPFVASLILAGAGFWFAALPLLLGVLATLSTTLVSRTQRTAGYGTGGGLAKAVRMGASPRIVAFMAINFLTMIGYAQFYYVFPTYATERFSSELVGVLFLIASAVIILGQVYVTALAQRISRLWRVVVANLLIGIGCLLLMASSQTQAILFVVVVFIVIGEMICGPLYQAQAVKIWQGRSSVAMAVQTCVWGAAEAIAAVLGLLAVARELSFLSFLLGFAACAIAAVVAWVCIAAKRPLIGIEIEQGPPALADRGTAEGVPRP
ncbi:MFS transporter [Pseudomonas sp. MSSRFD41]|nr:MFS transporter [Pseudomonas sp. MSSRFD41]MBC2656564.1 MFS transporter [Pseudomonas sp. MSSRFD41]